MRIRKESSDGALFERHVVIVGPHDLIMLTTPEHELRTYVYVRNYEGKLEFEGGESIVKQKKE